MGFMHRMSCRTPGIEPVAPLRWRGMEGVCAVFWQVRARAGGRGHYRSPDPRLMLFFDDVSSLVGFGIGKGGGGSLRPMPRLLHVPPGVELWTRIPATCRLGHLDPHLRGDRLAAILAQAGCPEPGARITRLIARPDPGPAEALGRLLADELWKPGRRQARTEGRTGWNGSKRPGCGSMRRWRGSSRIAPCRPAGSSRAASGRGCTTGSTPLQWQQQRVARAKALIVQQRLPLAEIALRLGFADQAHLTRVFRQQTGLPPARWRREQAAAPATAAPNA